MAKARSGRLDIGRHIERAGQADCGAGCRIGYIQVDFTRALAARNDQAKWRGIDAVVDCRDVLAGIRRRRARQRYAVGPVGGIRPVRPIARAGPGRGERIKGGSHRSVSSQVIRLGHGAIGQHYSPGKALSNADPVQQPAPRNVREPGGVTPDENANAPAFCDPPDRLSEWHRSGPAKTLQIEGLVKLKYRADVSLRESTDRESMTFV